VVEDDGPGVPATDRERIFEPAGCGGAVHDERAVLAGVAIGASKTATLAATVVPSLDAARAALGSSKRAPRC
jgi:hypothetical protein